MKKISILGSTGSIGVNALGVIKNFPEDFRVIHLTGNLNSEKMIKQGKDFLPKTITMIDEQAAEKVADLCNEGGLQSDVIPIAKGTDPGDLTPERVNDLKEFLYG